MGAGLVRQLFLGDAARAGIEARQIIPALAHEPDRIGALGKGVAGVAAEGDLPFLDFHRVEAAGGTGGLGAQDQKCENQKSPAHLTTRLTSAFMLKPWTMMEKTTTA